MFSPIPHGWSVTSTITASVYLFKMYYRFLNFYSKYFFAKTFNNVGFDLRGKIVATPKCSIPYSCHTIWNIDTSEKATNGKTKRNERCFLSIRYALFYLLSCFFILRIIPTLLLKVVLKKHHSKHDSLLLHCE